MKQGYNDRMDESLGMRNGPAKSMKQGYKARRDESRGMKYEMKGMKEMDNKHEKAPKSVNPYACNADASKIKKMPYEKRY